MPDIWYEHACVYSVDVRAFCDSNGDGVGDLTGLASRLDYLLALGVSAIWLQPIYATPFRDDGYDVSDYYSLDPRVGSLHDFVCLIEAAEERGIRVIMDLVADHTSTEHRWFREGRDPSSPYHDYYVWADEPHDVGAEPIFPGHQHGLWSYDDVAGAYYLHRFYDFEADLNTANPNVQKEVRDIVRFWLGLGAAGFRLDAAPYIAQKAGWTGGDGHAFLRELHDLSRSIRPDAVLLAETDVEPQEYAAFFGGGRELDLLFNFYFNNYLFLALAREQGGPIEDALRRLPQPPATGRYANWLRNHDELDLGRLSKDERDEVYAAFAPDPETRLYDRGIRRRLAPMLGGDPRRILSAFSVLLSLPGVPVILYGDEVGMGEDLSLPERQSVRTPMQWSAGDTCGFSSAKPDDLLRPAISGGRFGCGHVNVAAARTDPDSILYWVERLIRTRRESPEIARGTWTVLDTRDEVVAIRHDWNDRVLVAITNLSGRHVPLDLDVDVAFLHALVGDLPYEMSRTPPFRFDLSPYGFCWLRGELVRP